MVVLAEVQLQTVAVLRRVVAVLAAVLVDVRMRFQVRVQHGFVDTAIVALMAFERFGTVVVPDVVLEMVFVLGDERARVACENLVAFHVRF